MSASENPLLADILDESHGIDPMRRERGASVGRWGSSIASEQAPANLDAIVLRDPRTGVLAVTTYWANEIRWQKRITGGKLRSTGINVAIIAEHWDWAMEQPWGPRMLDELTSLRDMLHQVRYGVRLRPCPVCREPVRIDRFVTEHRDCLDTPLS